MDWTSWQEEDGKVIEQEEMHPVVKGLQQDLKI
jgi:hypothetical protein